MNTTQLVNMPETTTVRKEQKKEIIKKIENKEFIKFGSMSADLFDELNSSEKYCFCNSDYWCNKCNGEL